MISLSVRGNKLLTWGILAISCILATADLSMAGANPGPNATEKNPKPDRWEQVLDLISIQKVDRLGDKLGDIIFDLIEDRNLFQMGDDDTFSFKTSIHRRTFDNADILNSFTVVDKLRLQGAIPIVSDELVASALGGGPVSFWISTGLEMEFINIRTVLSEDYATLPTAQQRLAELQQEPWYQEFQRIQTEKPVSPPDEPTLPDPDASKPEKKKGFFHFSDPENHARYSKLWNMLITPFRIPFKAESLEKLANGEIVSFVGSGSIETGIGIKWDFDPIDVVGLVKGRVSYTAHVGGSFRISIMKENERFTRVKLTRIKSLGHGAWAGFTQRPNFLDGVFLISNMQKGLRIVPFQIHLTDTLNKILDFGYRYDMQNPDARKAYENAVRGRFALSDALALDPEGKARNFAESGVERIFSRRAESEVAMSNAGMKVNFLYRHGANKTRTTTAAEITLADGVHNVYTSSVVNQRFWKTPVTREKKEFNFHIALDLDLYKKNPDAPGAFNMIMEGKIEDQDTFPGELQEYMLATEDAVGKPMIFPRLPKDGNTGRSNFYYQVGLSNSQIEKLINVPKDDMWPHIERAFGEKEGTWATAGSRGSYLAMNSPLEILNAPLYLAGFNFKEGSKLFHALQLHKRWSKLQRSKSPKEKVERLAEMFYDKTFGEELARLVRAVLEQEAISFYVSGYNAAIGKVVDQGGSQLNLENVATKAQREIDFDTEGQRVTDRDLTATVKDLKASVKNGKVKITFELPKTPAFVFLQVRLDNWWWPFSEAGQESILVNNSNHAFTEGPNSIILDPKTPSGPFKKLADFLEPGNIHIFSVAVKNEGNHWGSVSTAKFRLPQAE